MAAAIPKADILNWEDYNMHRAHRYIASLFLTAAIAAPVAILAVPVPQDVKVQLRFYDKRHKDYHNWDDNENRNWERYNSENHRKSREFSKEHNREQQKYWNWRHSHPDNH